MQNSMTEEYSIKLIETKIDTSSEQGGSNKELTALQAYTS